jgi:hypothetical protein
MVASLVPPIGAQSLIQLLDLAVYTILTVALIVVYALQSSLQREIVEIQRKQSELEEEHTRMVQSLNRPVLVVESWKVSDNNICICVSNLGGHIASQIGVSVRLDPRTEFEPPDQLPSPTDDTTVSLNRESGGTSKFNNIETTTRRYVLANETGAEFVRSVGLYPTWRNDTDIRMGFAEGALNMFESGIKDGLLTIHLAYYDNLTKTRETRMVWCQKIYIEDEITLQEAVEQTQTSDLPMTAYPVDSCIPPQNRP